MKFPMSTMKHGENTLSKVKSLKKKHYNNVLMCSFCLLRRLDGTVTPKGGQNRSCKTAFQTGRQHFWLGGHLDHKIRVVVVPIDFRLPRVRSERSLYFLPQNFNLPPWQPKYHFRLPTVVHRPFWWRGRVLTAILLLNHLWCMMCCSPSMYDRFVHSERVNDLKIYYVCIFTLITCRKK